jgi:hypothetical protein
MLSVAPGWLAGRSEVIDGGRGGVGAAVGERPANDAGFGLFDFPAGCLLAAMVPSAFRAEVALAGLAVGVGDGVVEVAVDGLGVAAGGVAGRGPGAEQVLEFPAGGVVVFGVMVVALAAGDGLGGEVELGEKVLEPGPLGGVDGFTCVWGAWF